MTDPLSPPTSTETLVERLWSELPWDTRVRLTRDGYSIDPILLALRQPSSRALLIRLREKIEQDRREVLVRCESVPAQFRKAVHTATTAACVYAIDMINRELAALDAEEGT